MNQDTPDAAVGHTPGPWRVEQDTTLIWGACDRYDDSPWGMGYPVAEARLQLGSGSIFCRETRWPEAEANARLIAASPDMLSALKAIGAPDEVDLVSVSDSAIRGMLYASIRVARDAIARAEGDRP